MKGKHTTVALTFTERQILERAKAYYEEIFGVKVSWGLFLVSLALGVLSVRDIEGFTISCPWCQRGIEARMVREPAPLQGSQQGGQPDQRAPVCPSPHPD